MGPRLPSCVRFSRSWYEVTAHHGGTRWAITTSYKVKWWTHLGRLDGLTTRERRMTIRADARSLHARPWERRYRHAFMEVVRPVDFKLWAGRGELSFFFTRSPGGHAREPVGKIEDAPILNPRWEMQGHETRSDITHIERVHTRHTSATSRTADRARPLARTHE